MTLITIFVFLVFLFTLVSARLENRQVTAPMVFTAAGVFVGLISPEALERETTFDVFLKTAEVGLVLLLFTDASRTNLKVLRRIQSVPIRLLSVGMLLTMALGALAAKLVFPDLRWTEAAILAAILAPTDAGLGQVIVTSQLVPLKVREALNVEAGLNDGLSVPFLLFFIGLAGLASMGEDPQLSRFVLEQLGYGVILGGVIGLVGGWLLGRARRGGWISSALLPLGVVALPLLGAAVSEMVETSMFIVAFVAGLTIQVGFPDAGKHSVEFAEQGGQFLNLSVFFLFGLVVARDGGHFQIEYWLYAALSLTVVRMVPVAIALLGAKFSPASVLFMGWFGPRGLASIVLALVYLRFQGDHPGESTIKYAVMVTVLASIVLHGLTGQPGIKWYAQRVNGLGENALERQT